MTTAELLKGLRHHYLPHVDGIRQGAVFLTEVTAPDRVHRADAVHVGLWQSRGYTVDVHELKTSRSDFQRELDNPAKAEAWWAHCNTFWIVAPDTRVAPPELLPPGWGLMVPGRARRFKTVVKAEHRPLQPSTALLAALLVSAETDFGNALDWQRQQLETRHHQQVEEARREGALRGDPDARGRLKRLDQLEEALGFKLEGYDWDEHISVATAAAAIRQVIVERRVGRDVGQLLGAIEAEAGRVMAAIAAARKALTDGAAS